MWLKYGVSASGQLVTIDEVKRGKTHLTCLYCGQPLTAKKGAQKQPHFAHTGETCRPVSQRIKTKAFPSLPLYDHFHIQLKGEELEQLKVLWRQYGDIYPVPKDLISFRLRLRQLFTENDDGCKFTPLGKIPVGALPLAEFNQVQEPLLLSTLDAFQRSAAIAEDAGLSCFRERLADLRIYQAQWRRILANALYFLEVKAEGQCFYKIGITTRLIEERIAEIQRDLAPHCGNVSINLLGLWEHRGNVELYFKYRYQPWNYRIGKLTEYFQFPDVKGVLDDLFRMEPKVLGEAERWGMGPVNLGPQSTII